MKHTLKNETTTTTMIMNKKKLKENTTFQVLRFTIWFLLKFYIVFAVFFLNFISYFHFSMCMFHRHSTLMTFLSHLMQYYYCYFK